jgi:hypothetical protein
LSKEDKEDQEIIKLDKISLDTLINNKKKILLQELRKLWKRFSLPQWNDIICNSFFDALFNKSDKSAANYFMDIEKILDYLVFLKKDLTDIKGIIDFLKDFVESNFPYKDITTHSRSLYQQALNIITIVNQRANISSQVIEKFYFASRAEKVRDIGQQFITTFSTLGLFDLMVDSLPTLGISGCYIALYENPEENIEVARMGLAYLNNTRMDVSKFESFPSRLLLPDNLFHSQLQSTSILLVQALYFREYQIGYLIFDIQNSMNIDFVALRGLISSSLQGSMLVQKLQDALDNVKTLKGILPICSNCKNIRDDQGYWNRVDNYLAKHSDVELTHSLCPDCLKELYPDIDFE